MTEKIKKEVFVSMDVESDGPFPGLHSMLSVGYAAFTDDQLEPVSTFTRNLDFIEGATQDPNTMAWWNSTPALRMLYAETRENTIPGEQFVQDWIDWRNANFPPNEWDMAIVCMPLTYDWKFPDYYFCRYNGHNPLGFSRGIDLKSYAYARLGTRWVKTTKKKMPKRWFSDLPHTHNALDDAVEQGHLFMNMRREFQQLPMIKDTPNGTN